MAQRRMIHKDIIVSDDFIDMPSDARLLYIYLMLAADDDGVVVNPVATAHVANISLKNLTPLIDKRYLIELPDGLMVIRHWRQHNRIRKDRYTETMHQEVWKHLKINENETYEYCDRPENSVIDEVIC